MARSRWWYAVLRTYGRAYDDHTFLDLDQCIQRTIRIIEPDPEAVREGSDEEATCHHAGH